MKDGAVNLTGKKQRGYKADEGKGKSFPSQRASYTPSAAINEFAYGKDGGKASFDNPPEVVVGGSSVAQAPPAMPGVLKIGVDKNVSTPVSG